ncbi:hypothetical protein RJT34_20116 [Clitoria ternatea]|uniref:Uncharacterized protein n=1 Tax=Clitoria ternatea TaxID=43366 RepID=A0AAN9P4R3_CLITE
MIKNKGSEICIREVIEKPKEREHGKEHQLMRHQQQQHSSSSIMPSNSFPRRRHLPRSSSQEVQEALRLKRDRDWSKRRRAFNSHSNEEDGVENEQYDHDLQDSRVFSSDTASSASDRGRTLSSLPWKVTDEVISATVPRRTRSASVKRPHHYWVEEQSAEAVSPSFSNVSLPKKMKSIGLATGLPKATSLLVQEDIEIEIAELLYGLRASQNHESSYSQKHDSIDVVSLSMKKKVEDYSSSTLPPSNSAAESVRNENEQPAKTENPSTESQICHEIVSSKDGKEEVEEQNLNSGDGCGDVADGRSESKLEVDDDEPNSASTKGMFDVMGSNGQHKFEIDLMAPPPMSLSPERDNLLSSEYGMKVVDKVQSFFKKEKPLGEIEEVKIKFDLDNPNKHELEEMTVQSSSFPLSTAVSEKSSSVAPPGYTLETVLKTDRTTRSGSSSASQRANFILAQPRPMRCAFHHYIACNIFTHQQCLKTNVLLPLAISCGSVCDMKPNDVNQMHSAESVVVGKQSRKHSSAMNQNAAQEKVLAATSDCNLAALRSSGSANSIDSMTMKQLVLQQGRNSGSSGNLVHGPAFPFPPGQHQASVIKGTSQAGGSNSISSASSSNKFHNSAAGALGTSPLPAVAATMTFSYPNLAANDAPYVTIVPNTGYPFPFSTPLGASAAIRSANPAQSMPMLNGPLYPPPIFHPHQYPQQHPRSQPPVQPSYLNASPSAVSSSSLKQSQGTQANGNNSLISTAMQLQSSQKQHTSLSLSGKHETGIAGESAPSVASGTAYSQKNVFGQNVMIPAQPMTLSFMPSTTSDSVGGNSGNFGDKQQQQQSLKGGVEQLASQAFAISFAAYNGTNVPSNLNFLSMAQNPVIFQSLPDMTWQGYQAAGASHTTQQKLYSIIDGKSGGNSSNREDEKKATSGKPSTNGPTTLVFDNSSKSLNFVSSPMSGNWPNRSITSTATTTNLALSSNALNSQQSPQLLHLQQQHGVLQQQPAADTLYRASSTNATTAAKLVNTSPVYSQTQTRCKSSNQGSHSKHLGRNPGSQVLNTSIIASTTPTLQSFSQDQGSIQGHTQISFGGNYLSPLPLQGQQLFNNNQPLGKTVTGTPSSGGNLKMNSQGNRVSSSMNTPQVQQSENSPAGAGQKSLVCGRNVPSILSSCPSHLSELKY